MESVFTTMYETCRWGNNQNKEYKGGSGPGSTLHHNKTTYIPFLREFLQTHKIQTVVDLGCGDFLCGKEIYDDLPIKYFGYDAYKKIIEHHSKVYSSEKYTFLHLDFYSKKEMLQRADICILKDVLQHWPISSIYEFLDFLIEKNFYKLILLVNCCGQCQDNQEIELGAFRPLSSQMLPLKKYNPKSLYKFHSKEVALIECSRE